MPKVACWWVRASERGLGSLLTAHPARVVGSGRVGVVCVCCGQSVLLLTEHDVCPWLPSVPTAVSKGLGAHCSGARLDVSASWARGQPYPTLNRQQSQPKHNTRTQGAHLGGAPGEPGFGDHRGLCHGTCPSGYLLHKATLLELGDVADIPNM